MLYPFYCNVCTVTQHLVLQHSINYYIKCGSESAEDASMRTAPLSDSDASRSDPAVQSLFIMMNATVVTGNDGGAPASPMFVDNNLLGSDIGSQVYNWNDEELDIITELRQYNKGLSDFLKDIEITGPYGKKIPKKPTRDIDTLLNINKKRPKSEKLTGTKLNDYLRQKIVETNVGVPIFHRSVAEVNPKTLNDTLIHLKTGYKRLMQSNKATLCVSLDYGIWLNKAFALFSVENMGNTITWKEWIVKEIGIQDSYARKLRRVANSLGKYARFRELAMSFTDVLKRLTEIECMLASNDEIAEFWTHSSTRSVGSVPTNGPVGPPVGGLVRPPVSAARKSGPFYRNPNRYKPYGKRNYKK